MKWAQKKTESCPPRFIAIFRTILSDRVEDKHRKKQENLQSQSFWIYVILCWKKIRHVKEDRCDKIRRRHGTKQDESHSSQKGTTSYRRDDAYPSTLMEFLCALFQIPPLPLCSQERRSFGAFLKVRSRHFLSRECSKPFLSFPDRLLSRSRTFAGLWGGPFGGDSLGMTGIFFSNLFDLSSCSSHCGFGRTYFRGRYWWSHWSSLSKRKSLNGSFLNIQ